MNRALAIKEILNVFRCDHGCRRKGVQKIAATLLRVARFHSSLFTHMHHSMLFLYYNLWLISIILAHKKKQVTEERTNRPTGRPSHRKPRTHLKKEWVDLQEIEEAIISTMSITATIVVWYRIAPLPKREQQLRHKNLLLTQVRAKDQGSKGFIGEHEYLEARYEAGWRMESCLMLLSLPGCF